MEVVVEGLWMLADSHETKGEMAKSIKCLEAICQSGITFLPILEVKTRLRLATLLLNYSHSLSHAKHHLERAQLLLKSVPSCFDLKFRVYSLLSHCYHLVGAIHPQKQVLTKGLELSNGEGLEPKLWSCNFNSQLANALVIEGDYRSAISALENGYKCATEIHDPELQMFFATSILHVHLMEWDDKEMVEKAVSNCDEVWQSILPEKRGQCHGLLFYYELLSIFHLLRVCDYKNAMARVEKLNDMMRADSDHGSSESKTSDQCDRESGDRGGGEDVKQYELTRGPSGLTSLGNNYEKSVCIQGSGWGVGGKKIPLAPPPIDGEWLPKSAVYVMVDLMVVIVGRPKGNFKECVKRICSGITVIQEELGKLGITARTREVELQHSAIWTAGVYLMLLMQFLENKVVIELTRTEFVEAREGLVQMREWYVRFPTILQSCECMMERLRGQYAQSVGCFSEAAFHYIEASKTTESKSVENMCHIYAAISYISIGDADSSSQALDLVGPVLGLMDSIGVREKTCVLLAYGLLLTKQQNLQEARTRLATGLQLTHTHLGNHQLVAQYLSILGGIALSLHDLPQARDILRSSLTLSKKLVDIPGQISVLSILSGLYRELGEKGSEKENLEYQRKKEEELRRRITAALSSPTHSELIGKGKLEVQQLEEAEGGRRATGGGGGAVMCSALDIPESVGLPALLPAMPPPSLKRVDLEGPRRGKRRRK